MERDFGLIWLSGEISNFRRPSSGHYYFTLKDRDAQIRAVMFRTRQRYLGFQPADGQEVLLRGRLTVYEPRGEYQIVADFMEAAGEGALRLAFDQLKARLAAEGLFDEARKKRLPFLPRRIAVVTSPTGAAVRDFIRVARHRYENTEIYIYPVRVQGEGAAEEIATAVDDLNRWGGFDLIVLTRGGGSLEDLWAFNEEVLARSVAASRLPVVSAVGHEIDFTICDFAADLRAPTPSAAAELILRDKEALKNHLAGLQKRLTAEVRGRISLVRERLAHFQTRIGDPQRALAGPRQHLDDLTETMIRVMREDVREKKNGLLTAQTRLAPNNPRLKVVHNREKLVTQHRLMVRTTRQRLRNVGQDLSRLAARLNDLSPLAVLDRGYAVLRKEPSKTPVRSSKEVTVGQKLNLLLAEGELGVMVDEVIK